ncbi:MAG TPA: hypothetical protein VGF28_25085 [Thermoanaerobaculia bacterium]|jgi:hypothetical protein
MKNAERRMKNGEPAKRSVSTFCVLRSQFIHEDDPEERPAERHRHRPTAEATLPEGVRLAYDGLVLEIE